MIITKCNMSHLSECMEINSGVVSQSEIKAENKPDSNTSVCVCEALHFSYIMLNYKVTTNMSVTKVNYSAHIVTIELGKHVQS